TISSRSGGRTEVRRLCVLALSCSALIEDFTAEITESAELILFLCVLRELCGEIGSVSGAFASWRFSFLLTFPGIDKQRIALQEWDQLIQSREGIQQGIRCGIEFHRFLVFLKAFLGSDRDVSVPLVSFTFHSLSQHFHECEIDSHFNQFCEEPRIGFRMHHLVTLLLEPVFELIKVIAL